MTDIARGLLATVGHEAERLAASMTEDEGASPLGIFVAGLSASIQAHLSATAIPEDDATDAERRRDALMTRALQEQAAFMFRVSPSLIQPRPDPETAAYLRQVADLLGRHVLENDLPAVDHRTVDVDRLLKTLGDHLILSTVLMGAFEDVGIRGLNLPYHREVLERTIAAAARIDEEASFRPCDDGTAPSFGSGG